MDGASSLATKSQQPAVQLQRKSEWGGEGELKATRGTWRSTVIGGRRIFAEPARRGVVSSGGGAASAARHQQHVAPRQYRDARLRRRVPPLRRRRDRPAKTQSSHPLHGAPPAAAHALPATVLTRKQFFLRLTSTQPFTLSRRWRMRASRRAGSSPAQARAWRSPTDSSCSPRTAQFAAPPLDFQSASCAARAVSLPSSSQTLMHRPRLPLRPLPRQPPPLPLPSPSRQPPAGSLRLTSMK